MAGINKTLQSQPQSQPDVMLTKKEVMENLHIKDVHVFYDLINHKHLPHIRIGNKILVPLSKYSKWIESMIQ